MFTPLTTELDALILVGDDAANAERCLSALVSVSLDVPLRTWVIEVRDGSDRASALQERCVWTRSVEHAGTVAQRVNRALGQGGAPLVLVLDGSFAIDADGIRALVQHLRRSEALAGCGLGVLPRYAHELRPGVVGPALLVRRSALELVGALDERSFAGMQAEAEAWCRRAERAGAVVQVSATTPGRTLRTVERLVLAKPMAVPIHDRRTFRTRPVEGDRGPESLRKTLLARAREALG